MPQLNICYKSQLSTKRINYTAKILNDTLVSILDDQRKKYRLYIRAVM